MNKLLVFAVFVILMIGAKAEDSQLKPAEMSSFGDFVYSRLLTQCQSSSTVDSSMYHVAEPRM